MARKQKSPAADSLDELMGTSEAAAELGVSPATLRRWLADGRIEAVKVGRQWRFRRADLKSVVDVQSREDALAPTPASPSSGLVDRCLSQLDTMLAERMGDEGTAKRQVEAIEEEAAGCVTDSDPHGRAILARLLVNAVASRSSDLHFEPTAAGGDVRQRVDGVLSDVALLPRQLMVATIKECLRWTDLLPDERHRPQDGRFDLEIEGRTVDFRVSTVPACQGVAVVLRLLDRGAALFPLADLGFEPDQLEQYRRIIHRPNGLILIAGPAHCGKTTTIYASLLELADRTKKIMSAEDPVEYDLEGVVQTQIHPDVGRGFSQLTMAMLRQAADVIYVGEVRDADVGERVCKAALAGPLVFSTVPSNDAIDAIARLIDLGVTPSQLGASTIAVLSQRLVRKVCESCRIECRPRAKDLDALGLTGSERERSFFRGRGCAQCNNTGYRGRSAVYEIVRPTRDVQQAVASGNAERVQRVVRAAGTRWVRDVALGKLFQGETSIEELLRQPCFLDDPTRWQAWGGHRGRATPSPRGPSTFPVPDMAKVRDPAGVELSLILAQTIADEATRLRFALDQEMRCVCQYEINGKWYSMADPGGEMKGRIDDDAVFQSLGRRLARAVSSRRTSLEVGHLVRLVPGQSDRYGLPCRDLGLEHATGLGGTFRVTDYDPCRALVLEVVETQRFRLVELRRAGKPKALGFEFECFGCGRIAVHEASEPHRPDDWQELRLSGVPHDFCEQCKHQFTYGKNRTHPEQISKSMVWLLETRRGLTVGEGRGTS